MTYNKAPISAWTLSSRNHISVQNLRSSWLGHWKCINWKYFSSTAHSRSKIHPSSLCMAQYGCKQLSPGQNIDTTLSRRDCRPDNPGNVWGPEWKFAREKRIGESGISLEIELVHVKRMRRRNPPVTNFVHEAILARPGKKFKRQNPSLVNIRKGQAMLRF